MDARRKRVPAFRAPALYKIAQKDTPPSARCAHSPFLSFFYSFDKHQNRLIQKTPSPKSTYELVIYCYGLVVYIDGYFINVVLCIFITMKCCASAVEGWSDVRRWDSGEHYKPSGVFAHQRSGVWWGRAGRALLAAISCWFILFLSITAEC